MKVVCLEEEAFYVLMEKVVERMVEKHNAQEIRWVGEEEAMKKLNIKSKTTLLKLRNQQKIRFSQPMKKVILYDTFSIDEYLNQSAIDTL